MKQRTSPKWCPICNYKIRGKNHAKGQHHQKADKGDKQ